MHSTNSKTLVVAGVLIIALAGVVIWQHLALSAAREENSRLRAQIVQPPAGEPSREEKPQGTQARVAAEPSQQGTAGSSAILEKLDSLFKTSEADLVRQEVLLAKLQRNVADTPLFMQTLAEGKVEDVLLNDLVEAHQKATDKLVRLEKGGTSAPELAELRRQLDYLDKRIKERTQGILMGLKVRRDSTSTSLKNLLVERAKLAATK